MAERDAEASGWWDSWYKAAKDKSVEVLQFVKKDLDEFSSAVKSEASQVVINTTSVLKEKLRLDEPQSTANTVKKSVSSFFDSVSSAFNPSPDDEDEEAIVIYDSQPIQLTRLQAKQHALILNASTFLTDPDQSKIKQFEAWLDIVKDQLTTERLSKLMISRPELHMQYTKLVPDQVSHTLFWQRYLFRKALLEDEEAHKEALQKRAEKEKPTTESFQWDQVDFGPHVELSEEEQIRILSEYEKECENKKSKGILDDPVLDNNVKDNYFASDSGDYISEDVAEAELMKEETNMFAGTPLTPLKGIVANKFLKEKLESSLKMTEKKDLVIIGDGCSFASSSSGDKESNDDDWEREFDVDDADTEVKSENSALATINI